MKKRLKITTLLLLIACSFSLYAQNDVKQFDAFPNVNHPQIAYWFFNKEMLVEDAWKSKIDNLAANSKYTLIFLSSMTRQPLSPLVTKTVFFHFLLSSERSN